MSYSTEKTLSSIRLLVDEWSIRKEGGKQSFFVLKEIDKLLADTPVDDVVSSKDVADKKNEVRMLHLRIAKHNACERLREIERKSLTDADEISEHIINKNLRRIRIKQQKTIDELKDFIRDQGDQVADRDNRIEQLIVLNEALRIDIELAHNLSRDHIAGQDRFIEGLKIELDARNKVIKDFKAIEQKETDRLHAEIKQLRDTIVELRSLVDGTGVITDKQAMTMINNQATTIEEKNTVLRAYCDENDEVWGKLEKIGKIAEHPAHDCFSTALDEIIKIIQEE